MMGVQEAPARLFYDFDMEAHVPANHILREVDRFLDVGTIHQQLAPHYSHLGRPSVDPELIVRMLVIGYVLGIRSERRLCDEVHLNLAYRWFCRLDLNSKVPDHSTFSKYRHGKFRDSDLLRSVFEATVARCISEGLVGGHGFAVSAVALMPGTGEYSLATTPVFYTDGSTGRWNANVNSPAGKSDFSLSVETLDEELPNCEAASLIVSWFGDDLRCSECTLRPKVERHDIEGQNMPWRVSGLGRAQAQEIAQSDGRPIYGGTPSDQSVVEAIRAMNDADKAVMFYPFILMDQVEGNDLPDPYSDALWQPHLPWRGRITTAKAPNLAGTSDGTAAASDEVDVFFGTVVASDFSIGDGTVTYSGPNEWSLSRFILHYAALCASAGGWTHFVSAQRCAG